VKIKYVRNNSHAEIKETTEKIACKIISEEQFPPFLPFLREKKWKKKKNFLQ